MLRATSRLLGVFPIVNSTDLNLICEMPGGGGRHRPGPLTDRWGGPSLVRRVQTFRDTSTVIYTVSLAFHM